MAPTASKKGSQTKGNVKNERRSASRHSTPISAPPDTSSPISRLGTPTTSNPTNSMPPNTPYLNTPTSALVSSEPSIEALIEKACLKVAKPGDPPGSRELQLLQNKIQRGVSELMSKRGEISDRAMRQQVQKRKERIQIEQQNEATRAEEERIRIKREDDERRKEKKAANKKRSHDDMELDGDEKERKDLKDSLPSVGAHGLARQDGVGLSDDTKAPPSPPVAPGTIIDDPMDVAPSPASSADDDQSEPPATAPLYERIFGKDPTTADDPIVYDIRELHDDLTDQEKRDIMNVAKWPESDLRDLTAGDPPDADFSNAKPSNQINFSTFQTYIEPYIRPFTEEDVAFLKERGDRFTPYVIPERGDKGYREVWAAEDGTTGTEPARSDALNPNEPRGCMEDLDDEIAEQDIVSMGPVMSRLLSIIRPSPSNARKDDSAANEDANGDTTMTNGDTADGPDPTLPLSSSTATDDHKPISCLPSEFKAPTLPQLDYSILEERALQEFRYIGIIGPGDTPNFDAHLDDEISARLRTLQHELRRLARLNNIRKLRLLELTEERMAMQEYANIADDLDNQVNTAYLKRNRSLGKPSNGKKGGGNAQRAGGQKGVASVAGGGRGVSDGVKALMQKRRDWIEMVGPVVAYGRPPIPTDDETIFDDANVKRLEKIEREAEAGEVEGD